MTWVVGATLFLGLFFLFPRQMGILVGILVLVAAAVGIYFWVQNNREVAERSLVTGTAKYDPQRCADPKFPIFVSITNNASKTVNKITFDLIAKRPGYSSSVYSDYTNTDRIMSGHTVSSTCWSLDSFYVKDGLIKGSRISQLEWSIQIWSVTFQ